ncbi:hypothetical protein [Pseudomonas sp. BN515]|uniref:hypothetical protein n=1 Tax=Pseudomonas sp. BN515 TaxID=2567892 RepID=UPI0024583CD6|nr:hypothetical protein [Pseudomonas sp. BN515]MDH4873787.1 hypothetical protein [Pseudomonas sp. BN515]
MAARKVDPAAGGGMHERFDAQQGTYTQTVSQAFNDLQLHRSVDADAWFDNKTGHGAQLEKKP